MPEETNKAPFIDQLYDKINEVIGGDNNNQLFCLSLPGTILAPESFTYDYKNNAPKPPKVAANESRLANKLFDACHISVGDNGRTLPQQYRSAIDMLTPKLNAKIAEAKNILRRMLMTPYSYDFGEGVVTGLTLQQVFYRLYDQWIERKQAWIKAQVDKQAELRDKYPATSATNNELYQDEYLNWYQTVAEGYLEGLNEQMGKILGVFSPNDMKIIEGILDSGSGAELEEAREILNNARRSNPDGGYTYPVTLNPENWFEFLDNSFSGVDLLESPAALAQQVATMETERLNLVIRIDQISAAMPTAEDVQEAKNAVAQAQSVLNENAQALTSSYGEGAAAVFRAAISLAPSLGGTVPAEILTRLAGENGVKADGFSSLITDIQKRMADVAKSQSDLVSGAKTLTDLMMSAIEKQNLTELKPMLQPLQTKLGDIDAKIAALKAKIQVAVAIQSTPTCKDEKGEEKEIVDPHAKSAIMPNEVPHGFMQIVMEVSASTMEQASAKSSQASESSFSGSFFFCGYSHSSSSSSSSHSDFTKSDSNKMQIGMSVAKVAIDRAWFNPGLFLLSNDMFNVTTDKFAPASDYNLGYTVNDKLAADTLNRRFSEMNQCIFPCFPTAFVIARDITIKLISAESMSSDYASSIESHASSGGGFLCFGGHSSSSSSSSSSAASARSDGKSVTIRFADPQVIGYYLETTPPDKSVYIDDVSAQEQRAGYVTIIDFVHKCKDMLDEYNKFISERDRR
jgi:cell division septum initiation protein DivIVA